MLGWVLNPFFVSFMSFFGGGGDVGIESIGKVIENQKAVGAVEVILTGTISTVLGGIFLAVIFFFLRMKVFPLPEVEGRWYFEVVTTNTAYNPYRGMVLTYEVMLQTKDGYVTGSAEKIHECSIVNNDLDFEGIHRARVTVTGYIQKKYFGRDKMFLYLVEKGSRESSSAHQLTAGRFWKPVSWSGFFQSTIARQDGTCSWSRVENKK